MQYVHKNDNACNGMVYLMQMASAKLIMESDNYSISKQKLTHWQ